MTRQQVGYALFTLAGLGLVIASTAFLITHL